jgi:O-methyltransferase
MFTMFFIPFLTLIVCLGILLVLLRYFYSSNVPYSWTYALKKGTVSKQLKRLKNSYPFKGRFYIFWLQVNRLKAENIPGAFAEVGVYRGDAARILHAMDPERDLYLFDTFSGFPANDLDGETGEAATYTTENFSDVSVENVLKRFSNTEKIHLHQGYFPDTAAGLEEKRFALVNIDADLYKPTRAALEFFYPRVSGGGVILIHDNNYKWPGIIQAVDEFAGRIPENIVLMPDAEGTVIIVKNK